MLFLMSHEVVIIFYCKTTRFFSPKIAQSYSARIRCFKTKTAKLLLSGTNEDDDGDVLHVVNAICKEKGFVF